MHALKFCNASIGGLHKIDFIACARSQLGCSLQQHLAGCSRAAVQHAQDSFVKAHNQCSVSRDTGKGSYWDSLLQHRPPNAREEPVVNSRGNCLTGKWTCNSSEHAGLSTTRGTNNEQGVASLKGHAEVSAQLERLGRCEHVEGAQNEACLSPLGAHNA